MARGPDQRLRRLRRAAGPVDRRPPIDTWFGGSGSAWGMFVRSTGSGIAIGAATGLAIGFVAASVAARSVGVILLAVLVGVGLGTVLAVLPALVGGAAVALLLRARHPHPADPDRVSRELGIVFVAVIGGLELLYLVALAAGGEETDAILAQAVGLAVWDLILWPALLPIRRRLVRAWIGEA